MYFCWWCMWFLCVMRHTVLWGLLLVCLLVGHTHDEIDRLFSRIKVALAGHDYFTVIEMLDKITAGLPGFRLHTGHLSHVWAWKEMKALCSLLPLVLASAFIHCGALQGCREPSPQRSAIAFSHGAPRAHIPRNMTPSIHGRFLKSRPCARPAKKHKPSDPRSLSHITLPRARPSKKRDASDLRSLSRPQRSVMIHSLYGAGAWSA